MEQSLTKNLGLKFRKIVDKKAVIEYPINRKAGDILLVRLTS